MKTSSNIERKQFEFATKEEKARHNGVDTSRWGNDCPRIAVPNGWEDHQHTQQLIRRYLDNSFSSYDFGKRRLTLFLTEDEQQALCDWLENGHWVVRKYIFINQTARGLCLEVRIRKPNEEVVSNYETGLFRDYNGGIHIVNSSIFREVEILTRKETSASTKVVAVRDNIMLCNSRIVITEPVTILGKTVSEFVMRREQVETEGIKIGTMVEVRTDGDTAYIRRVVE